MCLHHIHYFIGRMPLHMMTKNYLLPVKEVQQTIVIILENVKCHASDSLFSFDVLSLFCVQTFQVKHF
jgi:hypothetical protein